MKHSNFNSLIDTESEKLQQVVAEIPFPVGFSFVPWGHHCLIITKCKKVSTGDSPESFEMRYEDENIWLTQKMMASLYDIDTRTISDHIQKIYEDGELSKEATIRNFRIVQMEGKGCARCELHSVSNPRC